MRSSACLLSVAATIAATPLLGQQLVADLNQTPPPGPSSSSPATLMSLGSRVVFAGTTAEGGREPWVTDGSAQGTIRLRDIQPGRDSSNPLFLVEYGGKALFSAIQPGTGQSLYITDGTPAGTSVLPALPIPANTSVQFRTLDKTGNLIIQAGADTYASDLTPAGTQLIPGLKLFVPDTTVGIETYGTTFDTGTGEWSLWATDGTVLGSRQVATGLRGRAHGCVAWNGRVYFLEPRGLELWVASTNPVTGGVQRHAILTSFAFHRQNAPMFVRGNRLVAAVGGKFYVSDLTQVGSGEITLPCTTLSNLYELNGTLYMRGSSPTVGFELWATDGTIAGTNVVADLDPGSPGSHPEHILNFDDGSGDALWFRAIIGGQRSLMKCTGPSSIQNLGPIPVNAPFGTAGLEDSGFVPLADGVAFPASGPNGNEPWFGSASQAPAEIIDLHRTDPGILALNRAPAALRDEIYLVGRARSAEYELIIADATQARTLDVVQSPNGVFGSGWSDLARLGDQIAFSTIERTALTAGTAATTTTILQSPQPTTRRALKVVGNRIYFLDQGLQVSHGGAPPVLVTGMPLFLSDFEVLGNQIVGYSSSAIYSTDGVTPAVLLESFAEVRGRLGDRLLYTKTTFPNIEIAATDGTLAGTGTIAMLSSSTVKFALGRDHAWFHADGQLLKTDGTVAGSQITSTQPGLDIESLVATANELYAVISTNALGRELWRFDHSLGQFGLVTDIAPGALSGVATATAIGDGDLVLLGAGDPSTGIEPWVSDGTAAGTYALNEINPGSFSSNPDVVGIAGDNLFLLADDGMHGIELWSVDLGAVGAANAQNYGSGCAGAGGIARLDTAAEPAIGNANFGLVLDQVAPTTLSAISVGTDTAQVSIGGCQLLVNGVLASTVGLSNLSGRTTMPVPLPNDPQLIGFRFTAQGAAIDGSAPSGFVTSDGLIVTIGQ